MCSQSITFEDEFYGEEVGANGQCHHGKGETHQLPYDGAVLHMSIGVVRWTSTYSRRHGRRYVGWTGRTPRVVLKDRLLLANCPSGRHDVSYVGGMGVVYEDGGTSTDESSNVMGGPCVSA
jgi:hypothetical protein